MHLQTGSLKCPVTVCVNVRLIDVGTKPYKNLQILLLLFGGLYCCPVRLMPALAVTGSLTFERALQSGFAKLESTSVKCG